MKQEIIPANSKNPEQREIEFFDGDSPVVKVTMRGDSLWLNQQQMAELFGVDRSVISKHVKNIFKSGELDEISVCAKNAHTAADGKTYDVTLYNLDMILSIGYRVNGRMGNVFRKWATKQLNELVTKGFVVDEYRVANSDTRHFDELVQKVRNIRTSEKQFYRKVTDVFATSEDYDGNSETAKDFFATVQNKFHFAIHGHTAAEVIVERVDRTLPFMGLTNWDGVHITQEQACIAKNYLHESELHRMTLLAEQFLSFAELRALNQIPMTMADWQRKLDDFLRLNDMEILEGRGTVSNAEMKSKVQKELKGYNGPARRIGRAVAKALPSGRRDH